MACGDKGAGWQQPQLVQGHRLRPGATASTVGQKGQRGGSVYVVNCVLAGPGPRVIQDQANRTLGTDGWPETGSNRGAYTEEHAHHTTPRHTRHAALEAAAARTGLSAEQKRGPRIGSSTAGTDTHTYTHTHTHTHT